MALSENYITLLYISISSIEGEFNRIRILLPLQAGHVVYANLNLHQGLNI